MTSAYEFGCFISNIGDHWYAYIWDEEKGQVWDIKSNFSRRGDFARGRSARAIKDVSYPYASKASAYSAIRRFCGSECYLGVYDKWEFHQ